MACGYSARVTPRHFDIAIIGGGPAGMTAALYAGRSKLRTAIVESKGPGGQLLNTEVIEDYPGFKHILGGDLASVMLDQALSFGAELIPETAQRIAIDHRGLKHITTDQGQLTAPAVIVTAGGNPRHLDVPGELEFAGRGVSYCAVCDGAFFNGKKLVVVGGGDAAVEEALFLTRYASSVVLIHRRDAFRAQPVLVQDATEHEKIELVMSTVVEEIVGNGSVQSVSLRNVVTGETSSLSTDGVFIFVGFLPNTGLIEGHTEHDEGGYYVTDPATMMTSVPGIFAAGDVRSQLTRQITTAVGDATTATIAAGKWVEAWGRDHGVPVGVDAATQQATA